MGRFALLLIIEMHLNAVMLTELLVVSNFCLKIASRQTGNKLSFGLCRHLGKCFILNLEVHLNHFRSGMTWQSQNLEHLIIQGFGQSKIQMGLIFVQITSFHLCMSQLSYTSHQFLSFFA